jgi:two-component system response regulator RegA
MYSQSEVKDPRRVLLIDDERSQLALAVNILRVGGYSVTASESPEDAYNQLRQQPIDKIVVEPNLPRTTWYNVLHQLRRLAPRSEIIVMTSFPSRALRDEALSKVQVRSVLRKPVSAEALLGVLRDSRCHTNLNAKDCSLWLSEPRSLARFEWEHLNDALQRHLGNVTAAARELTIPRQTFYRKLRRHPPRQ